MTDTEQPQAKRAATMTNEELRKQQSTAAIELIVQFSVYINYRRSAPLGDDAIIKHWVMLEQRYHEALDSITDSYYKDNGIIPYKQESDE